MAKYSNPPPALAGVIQQASSTHGVPVDILTGVWKIESGGSYPDNAHNSSGYGGLFGTKDYTDTDLGQANYAASVLARLYKQYGSWSAALYHYSGGAYTSVPGQTTKGGNFVPPHGNAGGTTPAGKSSPPQQSTSSGSSSNPLDALGSIASTFAGIPDAVKSAAKPVGIGLGLGIVAIILIIGGILVIALPAIKKASPLGAVTGE